LVKIKISLVKIKISLVIISTVRGNAAGAPAPPKGVSMPDYIPDNDGVFDGWFKYINQYVAEKCGGAAPQWTHIPQAAQTAMNIPLPMYTRSSDGRKKE
jgi:hypothetical protein